LLKKSKILAEYRSEKASCQNFFASLLIIFKIPTKLF